LTVGKRSKGRAILLQAMYASRVSGQGLLGCLEDQLVRRESAPDTAVFARELARKVINHGDTLEQEIAPLLTNWELDRVGLLERLILTLALTEFHHCPEVPYKVVIDEACELARMFCDEHAVGFVNGLLDRAAAELHLGSGEA